MRALLPLAFALALFTAGVASESRGSDLLQVASDGWYSWQVGGTEDLQIHALIESGRPVEFYLPSLQCYRRNVPTSADLGTISPAESIAWLRRFISPRTEVSSEVMAAISMHPGREAVEVLQDVVRSDRDWENRKQAVFWLAQSQDESAYVFLDSLLSDRED
jgi:hypothetical protein